MPLMNRRRLATSSHPLARMLRGAYRGVRNMSVPAPRPIIVPALYVVLAIRTAYYFVARVFVCEPLFKAYCRSYGKNLHTGVFLHWIQGSGDIILGDDVTFDGKVAIAFGARFADRPTLRVGNGTGVGHGVSFAIGREISIGAHCRIAAGATIFDSSGHPADPQARLRGEPPHEDEVKPVRIEDNVWVGRDAIIHPGVTIGEGSVVSAAAVVLSDVPPLSIVAGNPARKIGTLDAG